MQGSTTPATRPASRVRRVLTHPLTRLVAGVFVVALCGGLVQDVAHSHGPAAWREVGSWFLAAAAALAGYVAFVALTERRAPRELAPRATTREAAIGFVCGAATVGLALGLLAAAGACRIAAPPAWTDALLKGLAFMTFIAVLEELLSRALLLRLLEGWWGPRTALVVSSLLFGAAHLPGGAGPLAIVNTVVAGLWLGTAWLATRRLGLSIGLHLGWNWTLGRVFSIPVSGHADSEGAIPCALHGPDWLTGGAYGLEGSVVTGALLAASALFLWRLAVRRGHVPPMKSALSLRGVEPSSP